MICIDLQWYEVIIINLELTAVAKRIADGSANIDSIVYGMGSFVYGNKINTCLRRLNVLHTQTVVNLIR